MTVQRAAAAHPIPPALFLLAERYGQAIAAGDMPFADAEHTLELACHHHRKVGPDHSSAVMARLLAALARVAHAEPLQAAADIRQGLQPMLLRRVPTAALRAEAYRLSAARLLRPDCDAIVREEIQRRIQPEKRRA